MNRCFKDFGTFIRLHDGFNKPKIDFQQMYKLFPEFTFEPTREFGQYEHFGEAFENKNLSMIVTIGKYSCLMVYREYGDANENTAYIT